MKTLDELALLHKTDKASDGHNYAVTYDKYLTPLRQEQIVLLEVGIGGYGFIDRGGESMKMWHDYFPQALIAGVDLHEKHKPDLARIHYFRGSQDDAGFLNVVISQIGRPTVIVDDGSHVNPLTIQTFEILFHHLLPGGFYIVEDVHTSYWEKEYLGNSDPREGDTIMAYLQQLTHQLNDKTLQRRYRNVFAGQLEFVHFYPEMVIIKKSLTA
jgi:demethylmacrocin O-methyltransferase